MYFLVSLFQMIFLWIVYNIYQVWFYQHDRISICNLPYLLDWPAKILLLILDYKLSILRIQDQPHKLFHLLSKMFRQYLLKLYIFCQGFLKNFFQEHCQIFSIIVKEVMSYIMGQLTFYLQFLQVFNSLLIFVGMLILFLLPLLKIIKYLLQARFYVFTKSFLLQPLNNLLLV